MFSKDNPFLAPLVERFSLCAPGSAKQTYHISLDLRGSNIQYQVGDSFGIFPENAPWEVDKILQLLKLEGDEEVVDRKQVTWTLRSFLQKRAALDAITPKFFAFVYESFKEKPPALRALKEQVDSTAIRIYLQNYHLWDFLEEWNVRLTPQQLADHLLPLMPRFYSAASSQRCVGERVDLTVADIAFTSNGHLRHGVCSQYLCHTINLSAPVPVFAQPSHAFSLSVPPQCPLIMVGPGTGVAPYRGFMQERLQQGSSSENWLFFGERHEKENFFYQTFWEELVRKQFLKLTTAFSRDQAHKIYVQHRMKEHGRELFSWLERGAYLYVCGDAKRMAKDVEAVLAEIVAEYSAEDPKAYLKNLRAARRYQRDVY